MNKSNKIVLTGFEPFNSDNYNPSQAVAEALDQTKIRGFKVKSYLLPVNTNTAPSQLAEILAAEQPAALVSLGLAWGREGISLERVAINLKDWGEPDNAGQVKIDEPIDPAGPTAYLATLPLRLIKANLNRENISANLSSTAGLYLCNQIMYCGLWLAATQYQSMLSGFIHLPATPEMALVIGRAIPPTLALNVQVQAIEIALNSIVETI